MLHFLLPRFAMPYRRTANVVRKLAARHDAILAAACETADAGGMAAVQIAPVAARAGTATAAPGPLSALAAAISAFAARALERRRLAFALMAEPVEPEIDAARAAYRQALTGEFERLIREALEAGRLPDQDAALAAPALLGALVEGLIGPHAPAAPDDPAKARARVQMLTLFALRALGVIDARARGLVVQTLMPQPSATS